VRTVSFTGGTATGKHIAEVAGMKKLSLELGGKSPVLIFEDADLTRALDAALFTIFSLNGERCTAGSRIFVQESIYDASWRVRRPRRPRPGRRPAREGHPGRGHDHQGPLGQGHRLYRVGAEGRRPHRRGGTGRPAQLPARVKDGNFIQPTVFADVDNKMRIAQEEIFGPPSA